MGEVVKMMAAHLARFPVGCPVMHITQGRGTVHSHIDESVVVRFDKIKNGKHVVGAYDAEWFKMYPRFLVKREAAFPPRDEPPKGAA